MMKDVYLPVFDLPARPHPGRPSVLWREVKSTDFPCCADVPAPDADGIDDEAPARATEVKLEEVPAEFKGQLSK